MSISREILLHTEMANFPDKYKNRNYCCFCKFYKPFLGSYTQGSCTGVKREYPFSSPRVFLFTRTCLKYKEIPLFNYVGVDNPEHITEYYLANNIRDSLHWDIHKHKFDIKYANTPEHKK